MLWPIALTSVGYVLAILGSYLLVRGSAKDVGIGRIPLMKSDDEATRFHEAQNAAIARRARFTRWGFQLLLAGMIVQLSGYLWGACSMPKPS